MSSTTRKIGVLGSTGFVGTNLCAVLASKGIPYVGGSKSAGSIKEYADATDASSISGWISRNQITDLVNLAAKCGGIGLNKERPADLWRVNTEISTAVLEAAAAHRVRRCLIVGTVCSYARNCPPPFSEEDLMRHGLPEETNRAYGISKLNAIFGAIAYGKQYALDINCLIPVNMYGKHDHFDDASSHVVPAMIKKIMAAKMAGTDVTLWGNGEATREFLYAEDFAEAVVLALDKAETSDPINIGTGKEISMRELANLIKNKVGFSGNIIWDESKPNGQPRRCLNTKRAKSLLGFEAKTSLSAGLDQTIDWYVANIADDSTYLRRAFGSELIQQLK